MTARTYTKRHRSVSTTTYVKLNPGEAAVIIKPGAIHHAVEWYQIRII